MIVTNCSFKKVVKHHGVSFLEKKQKNLVINVSNKNEIIDLLGNPSTRSKFNNDVWIYIERKQTQSRLKNLGRMKIYKNDVLVLEIDNYGILKKKDLMEKDVNNFIVKNSKAKKYLDGKKTIKIIFVKNKIINYITSNQ